MILSIPEALWLERFYGDVYLCCASSKQREYKYCSKTHHNAADAARIRYFKTSTVLVNSSVQSISYDGILLAIINGIFYETSEGRFRSSVRNKTIKFLF